MALLRQIPFFSQPQVACEIDWSNPICRGLIICETGINNKSGLSNGVIKSGRSFIASSTTSGGYVHPVSYSGNELTTLLVASPPTTGSNEYLFDASIPDRDALTRIGDVYYWVVTGVTVAAGLSGSLFDSSGSIIALRSKQSAQAVFKNGVLFASYSATLNPGAVRNVRLCSRFSSTEGMVSGGIALYAQFNRALSDAEIRSISTNPWQIFKPIPRRIFVPVSAGSDVTITATLGNADATGFTADVAVSGAPVTINAALGTATASGLSATLAQAFNLSANLGTATASGAQATVNSAITVSASLGAASAAGYTAALEIAYTLAANLGTASATGNTATIFANESIACAIGTALASGYSATVTSTAQLTDSEKIDLILDILSNKQTLDPVSHQYVLYADDGVTVLKTALAWEDSARTIPYRGQSLQALDPME